MEVVGPVIAVPRAAFPFWLRCEAQIPSDYYLFSPVVPGRCDDLCAHHTLHAVR